MGTISSDRTPASISNAAFFWSDRYIKLQRSFDLARNLSILSGTSKFVVRGILFRKMYARKLISLNTSLNEFQKLQMVSYASISYEPEKMRE